MADFGADRALAFGQARSGLVGFAASITAKEMLVDDVTSICQRIPFIEVAPPRMFDVSLLSELADASDRLAARVADLQERQGAGR